MGLGVITGSLCIVRTVLNWQNLSPDITWGVIPNWHWRAWEVYFGINAACIPTLRPGWKWLIEWKLARFPKTSNSPSRKHMGLPTSDKWTPPKPSAIFKKSRNHITDVSTGATYEDDFLPLQKFDSSVKSQANSQGDERYPRDADGTERREALHIPGDLSTHRPGHLKRLDSEAKVGGGLGAEEVDHRI